MVGNVDFAVCINGFTGLVVVSRDRGNVGYLDDDEIHHVVSSAPRLDQQLNNNG